MNDEYGMPPLDDPAWAKRLAKIEKEFRKAERRRPQDKPRRGSLRVPRRFRTAYAWVIIMVAALAFAVVVHPWRTATEQVPVANTPQPISTQTGPNLPKTLTPQLTTGAPGIPNVGGGDPFSGSPAQAWPSADTGVIMPPATTAGPYTAAQVSAALGLAHRYILLTRADTRVVVGHQVQLLTALMSPEQLTGAGIKTTGPDSILQPTLLAPGNKLSAPIRVNGTVHAAYHPDDVGNPMLQVTTNLVWAYPLTPQPGVTALTGTIALRHDQMTLDLYPAEPRLKGKVFVEQIQGYQSNIDCEYADEGLLGLPRINDPSRLIAPSGTMPTGNQAYDPSAPINTGTSCK